jgi:hypothetical protein
MTTKPDFKFGDRVIHIGERQKRGVVSRVFRSGGVWWLAFEVNRTGGTRRGTSGEWLKAALRAAYYRRARFSALAGGGAFGAGLGAIERAFCAFDFRSAVSASNFPSAARSGSRRGA